VGADTEAIGALSAKGTFLILSQVYVPDPASVGQHMHDVAAELIRRGWRVIVLTARRGYDDPSLCYSRRETRDGVTIIRLALSSFGKKSMGSRLLGQILFLIQCVARGLLISDVGAVLVSTSPPMCSAAGLAIRFVRRVPLKFWVMDLNPDQAVALGKVAERSVAARLLEWLNRRMLRNADDVVVLDRYMEHRIRIKGAVNGRLSVSPPWPHEDHLDSIDPNRNPFRISQGLNGKFVFMYSGNMSLASPVKPILDAASRMRAVEGVYFLFVGGGLGKRDVEQAIAAGHLRNGACLPYQPMSSLRFSLSAADVHIVTLGKDMVGIVHPCKIYGAMRVGRPILYVGPRPSHLSDILEEFQIGWQVDGSDVETTVGVMQKIAATDRDELSEMGRRAGEAIQKRFSKNRLCGGLCDIFERVAPVQVSSD